MQVFDCDCAADSLHAKVVEILLDIKIQAVRLQVSWQAALLPSVIGILHK